MDIEYGKIEDLIVIDKAIYEDKSILETNYEDSELVSKFFNDITCGDKEIERLLYEVIGYSLTKTAKFAKAFIFKGNGRNGKSKIFRIIEAILSNKDYIKENERETFFSNKYFSHEHLEKLSGCKSGSKNTINVLKECTVNIAEDQKQPKYINTGALTKLISGEPIAIGKPGKEKDDFIPYATLLFSVNDVIDFKEYKLNIRDRCVVIPFQAEFTDEYNNKDIDIEEKICKDKPLRIIAIKAIEAFKKANSNGKFSIPQVVEEATKNYFMECNNVFIFCNELPIKYLITKDGYYNEYCKWCELNNRDEVSNSIFGKEILSLGYCSERYSINGKRKNYYVAPDYDSNNNIIIYQDYIKNGVKLESSVEEFDEDYCVEKHRVISFNDYLCECLHNEKYDIGINKTT